MLSARTRWVVPEIREQEIDQLQQELGTSRIVTKLMLARGWKDKAFIESMMKHDPQQFHDPFLMKDMTLAVNRLQKAIQAGEKIRIYGDYDCDGVSSTSIMVHTFQALGATFDYYIPNRFTEGYGLNIAAMDKAAAEGVQLILTVDNGISAKEVVQYAMELGLEVIVTDHHEPPPELPECVAVINPKQEACTYPYSYLAGAGVALKLAQALLGRVPLELFDIACIGTIADLVPLTGENRYIAAEGLKQLNQTRHIGLQAMIESLGLQSEKISEEHVGFGIGPRVNACGRMADAGPAVELFTTLDREEAMLLVQALDQQNTERQQLVEKLSKEAIQWVEAAYPTQKPRVLIVAQENWHMGVLGIVASKLVERYYLPVIVLSIDPDSKMAKGSARSIAGFDMYTALRECDELLPHYGGHPMAAGLSILESDIARLNERLNMLAEQWLTEEDFIPLTLVDLCCNLDEISLEVIEELEHFAPFGVENPKPMIMIQNVGIEEWRQVGTNQNHLKCKFSTDQNQLEGIGFFLGNILDQVSIGSNPEVIGHLEKNEWNGRKKPQLQIKDLRVQHKQYFDLRHSKKQASIIEQVNGEQILMVTFGQPAEQGKWPEHWQTLFWPEEASISLNEAVLSKIDTLLLYDAPPSIEMLNSCLTRFKHSKRIYFSFVQNSTSHFLSTIPTREHFKWYYAFIQKQGELHVEKHGQLLAKRQGWSLETIHFMTEVFLELGFAKMEKGVLSLSDQPNKQPLTSSKLYLAKQAAIEVEQALIYSSYSEIIHLFETWMTRDDKEEVVSGF